MGFFDFLKAKPEPKYGEEAYVKGYKEWLTSVTTRTTEAFEITNRWVEAMEMIDPRPMDSDTRNGLNEYYLSLLGNAMTGDICKFLYTSPKMRQRLSELMRKPNSREDFRNQLFLGSAVDMALHDMEILKSPSASGKTVKLGPLGLFFLGEEQIAMAKYKEYLGPLPKVNDRYTVVLVDMGGIDHGRQIHSAIFTKREFWLTIMGDIANMSPEDVSTKTPLQQIAIARFIEHNQRAVKHAGGYPIPIAELRELQNGFPG